NLKPSSFLYQTIKFSSHPFLPIKHSAVKPPLPVSSSLVNSHQGFFMLILFQFFPLILLISLVKGLICLVIFISFLSVLCLFTISSVNCFSIFFVVILIQ